MVVPLLPASAAPFKPRARTSVIADEDLTLAKLVLEKVHPKNSRLRTVRRYELALAEVLSSEAAIWTLAFFTVPVKLYCDSAAPGSYVDQRIPIKAYAAVVDLTCEKKVTFKLTPETIDALVQQHENFFSTHEHSIFIQNVNSYVLTTRSDVLSEIGCTGGGTLPEQNRMSAEAAIWTLWHFSLPPMVTEQIPQFEASLNYGGLSNSPTSGQKAKGMALLLPARTAHRYSDAIAADVLF